MNNTSIKTIAKHTRFVDRQHSDNSHSCFSTVFIHKCVRVFFSLCGFAVLIVSSLFFGLYHFRTPPKKMMHKHCVGLYIYVLFVLVLRGGLCCVCVIGKSGWWSVVCLCFFVVAVVVVTAAAASAA